MLERFARRAALDLSRAAASGVPVVGDATTRGDPERVLADMVDTSMRAAYAYLTTIAVLNCTLPGRHPEMRDPPLLTHERVNVLLRTPLVRGAGYAAQR